MDWIRENWFFILFFIFFIWMHLSGHGCGGHGHRQDEHGKEEEHEGHSENNRFERKDR